MLTLLETAGLTADVENSPGKDVPTILRRFRQFDAKGLLPTHREDVGRREGRLDKNGAAQACLLSELTDMGYDLAVLRQVNEALTEYPKMERTRAIEYIVAAVEQEIPVTITIDLALKTTGGVKRRVVRIAGAWEKSKRAQDALQLVNEDAIVRTKTIMDVTAILSPFLKGFDKASVGVDE